MEDGDFAGFYKVSIFNEYFPSFKDCEPEELTDWSMDEKCSFCNLQREAVSVSASAMKLF